MMRVGFLHDTMPYVGGAERTMAEFAAAAPQGVEVVWCPAGKVQRGLDRYVVGNCRSYDPGEVPANATRYHHDMTLSPADEVLERRVFCSPTQRKKLGLMGDLIPPALRLGPLRAVAKSNHRSGAVCVGRMSYGKGMERLAEYSQPVDVYSSVPVASQGQAHYQGEATDLAKVLSQYETFVFLPTAFEPFGRAVVEAWAAGLRLVLNRNVGATYWLTERPAQLDSAAADFWRLVCKPST